MVKGVITDRCPTGIVGFDKLCRGGFVRQSTNLLVGGPGSGKTTFLLQFLWNGSQLYGENGLYISFEPDILETFKDASNLGWDFQKLDAANKCKLVKMSPNVSQKELSSELMSVVSKYDIKRVCFDPVTVFALSLEREGEIREKIFELSSLLKRLNVTVLLSDEDGGDILGMLSPSDITRTNALKFTSDSVVMLHSTGLGGIDDRAVRIVKMRRTNHIRGPVPMEITDAGIKVTQQE